MAGLLSACQVRGPELGGLSGPQSTGPAMELAQRLWTTSQGIPAVAVRGSANYVADNGGRHHFQFEALAQKPDIFQFLALGPTGSPAFRLLIHGEMAQTLDYGRKVHATGSRADLGAHPLPIPLSPEELTSLLIGGLVAPPSQAELLRVSQGPSPRTVIRVWPEGGGFLARLTLDGAPGAERVPVIRELVSQTRSGERLEINYDDIRAVTRRDAGVEPRELDFPFRIAARLGGSRNRRSLAISYDQVVLGALLDPGSFYLATPVGFAQEWL
ncbi:MAG: hypothetical protein LBR11_12190 [Deltaproteobacteria bacterium]|nr:hypothetical protein [Deltaproteobacteria bacterium]